MTNKKVVNPDGSFYDERGIEYNADGSENIEVSNAGLAAAAFGLPAHAFATANDIVRSEWAGQAAVVNSDKLPKEMHDGRELFEAAGIVFGEAADDLFLHATLPAGWKRKATEHALHSYIVDANGRERIHIFFKAAFYDRSAFMSLARRYHAEVRPVGGWVGDYRLREREGVILDGETVVAELPTRLPPEPISNPGGDAQLLAWYERKDAFDKELNAFIAEKFPDYRSPLAYWD